MSGGDYVRDILLPNFYFHIAIAHAILRHEGLSVGKRDYLGNLPSTALDISVPTDSHRPTEFLTSDQCIQWVGPRGRAAAPGDSWPEFGYLQVGPQPLPVTVRDLTCALMETLGG